MPFRCRKNMYRSVFLIDPNPTHLYRQLFSLLPLPLPLLFPSGRPISSPPSSQRPEDNLSNNRLTSDTFASSSEQGCAFSCFFRGGVYFSQIRFHASKKSNECPYTRVNSSRLARNDRNLHSSWEVCNGMGVPVLYYYYSRFHFYKFSKSRTIRAHSSSCMLIIVRTTISIRLSEK